MHRNHTLPRFSFGVAAVLTAALAIPPVISPVAAYAATSSELQSELDAARAELDTLDGQIMTATRDLEIAQSDLEQTEADIETVSASIEQNETKLTEKRSTLSGLMSDNYKTADNVLSFVLGATNFEELISRVFYANKMSDTLSGAISEVAALQAQLDSEKAELEQKRTDQEAQTKQLAANAQSFQEARAQQAAYVNSLSAEVQAALEAERQAELERQRQEAEEALRAEQEAMQSQQNQQQGGNAATGDGSTSDGGASQGGDASSDAGTDTSGGSTSDGSASNGNGGSASNGNGGNTGSGGTSGGSAAKPDPEPSTPSTPSQPSGTKQAAVQAAMTVLGYPYVTGGSYPSEGFDCSGLVWWAYQQAGVSIPRSQGSGMYPTVLNSGTWTTDPYSLSVGDLVFYSYNGGASTYHVAMYIGGGQVIHANGIDVCITGVYYDTGFIGGGSIL